MNLLNGSIGAIAVPLDKFAMDLLITLYNVQFSP
jgi:hypothetical protein